MTTELSQKIKNMGLVCAVLVVAIHVPWPRSPGTISWWINETVRDGIARMAVPYFFVVSGYMLSRHMDEEGWWLRETKKRVRSLLVPFFCWGLLSFVVLRTIGFAADFVSKGCFDVESRLSGVSWLSVLGLNFDAIPGLIPLWFVRALFILVLASPVLKVLTRNFGVAWLVLSLLMYLAHTVLADRFVGSYVHGVLSHSISLLGVFYFSVGIWLRTHQVAVSNRVALLTGAIGLFCIVLAAYCHLIQTLFPSGVGCFTNMFVLISTWHFMSSRKWPENLTSLAFPLFLMHCMWLELWEIGAHMMKMDAQTTALCGWLVAVIASWLLVRLLFTFFPKVSSVLFGGRGL